MIGGSARHKLLDQHLIILMVKLAVAASLASVLTRSGRFNAMLMREERTLLQRVQMAVVSAFIFGSGVAARVMTRDAYQAVDLGLEGSLVVGMLGGYVTGLLAGVLISIPAMLNGELMSMTMLAAAGILGGLLRDVAPDRESIWRLTFPDQALFRLLRKRDLRPAAFSLLCVLAILSAELLRSLLARFFGARGVFALQEKWRTDLFANNDGPWILVAVYATTVLATVLPLKIWNTKRYERQLELQRLSLNEARLLALSRQINPHFLFNTLNSVAALIRQDPNQARQVVYKLSKILRRLLRQMDNLTPLREELSFIDDYLAIEMVRFDKLHFSKEVDAATLDMLVPSMLLQPLVENSIRHGLASKVAGGTICVRSRLSEDGRLHIAVEDDGVGIPEEKLTRLFSADARGADQGIGVTNVNERLKVLYGDDYKMWVDSRVGEGTRIDLELPGQGVPLKNSPSPEALGVG